MNMMSGHDERVTELVRVERGVLGPASWHDNASHDRDMRLRDYWLIVRSHAAMIAALVAIVTVPVGILMLLTPDYYTAKARLEINMERSGPDRTDAPDGNSFVSNDPAYFNTQLQLISSPSLLSRVVRRLELQRNQVFVSNMRRGGRLMRRLLRLGYLGKRDNRTGGPLPSGVLTVPAEELADAERLAPYVADVERRLTVEPVMEKRTLFRETRLVEVLWEHPNPQLAALVVNGIAENFVAANLEKERQSGANTNTYLTRRTSELQVQVREAEEALIRYANTNQILTLEPGQNVAAERLVNLNRQLLEAEHDRKQAEANFRQAQVPGAASALADESVRTVLGEAQIKIADLRARRAQLLVGATERWPEVQEINQQILALERDVESIRTRAAVTTLAGLETKYNQTLAHERALSADFNRQRVLMQAQNQAAVNYRLLQQEIETKKNLLDQSLKSLGENDLAQAAGTNNVRILDYAITPNADEPDGPWRLLYIGLASMLALMIGVAGAVAREFMDETLKSSGDVQVSLQLPTLGLIRSASRRRLLPISSEASRGNLGIGRVEGAVYRPQLLIDEGFPPDFAEDFRRLRTSLLLSTDGKRIKTVLITSSEGREGKTTTAINLAASLTQMGAKVLLVDADMRSPSLHAAFGIENTRGLSSMLAARSGNASDQLERSPLDAVVRHESSGIYVLPAGPESANPSELLGSEPMHTLLSALEPSFTHVLIDSPPIGLYTDGVVLSPIVDGVLLVVRASTTSRETVQWSQQLLTRVGATVLGVVLNNVEFQPGRPYGQRAAG